ncbi:MAG: hypothetical protein EXS42_07135 [Lacunisphaera sp.]|nr:hypothetical protein [Lacunisphaera sp.]
MSRHSPAEKIELGAIAAATGVVAWLAPGPGIRLELGELVAGGALLMLVEGFFRDLWLLREARRWKSSVPPRAARCMCV